MLGPATLSTDLMVPALREIARHGPDIERRAQESGLAIFAKHGLAVDSFSHLADRIPYETAIALLENAVLVTGDDAFALRAGTALEFGDFGLFQFLTGSACTLRASIQLAARYLPLINDGVSLELCETGNVALWKQRSLPGLPTSAAADDYLVSAFLSGARHMLGIDRPPPEVWMMQRAPRNSKRHDTTFGTTTRFGKECNAILLPRAALDLPLATANPALLRVLERYAQELLPPVGHTQPFLQRVREQLSSKLAEGASLVELAHALHMSESSVQRRLRALGTSHSEVLDELRRERSLELLADLQLNLSEVAFQLGFAHRSAFHRAFKRWHGRSPSEHRARESHSEFYRFYRRERQPLDTDGPSSAERRDALR